MLNGKVIKTWQSARAAGVACGFTNGAAIQQAIYNGTKSAGFHWAWTALPDLEGEVWRKHPTIEALVSNLGRVQRPSGAKTFGSLVASGYCTMKIDGTGFSVHRLVAETWLENPLNKPMVDHLNGKRSDNRVENLEYVTAAENAQRAEIRRKSLLTIENDEPSDGTYRISYYGKCPTCGRCNSE